MNNEKEYWNKFYSTYNHTLKGTNFCMFIIEYFNSVENIRHVLDCGFGSGRDSFIFANKYNITGVDSSGFIPHNDMANLNFICDDFVTFNKTPYDLIYLRFSFHSITNKQQDKLLDSICQGSYVAIETRSKKGENDYVVHGRTHFRNYTDFEYLQKLLINKKFNILFMLEGRGFAKYMEEDPICIRVIAQKNTN